MDFSDYYDFYDDSVFGLLGAFTAGFVVMALIIVAAALVFYILRSIGFMRIARNRGLANPWIAWIPFIGSYTTGAVVDDIAEKEEGTSSVFRYIFLCLGIADLIIWLFVDNSSITGLFALAYYVLRVVALQKIFKCYRPESATVWTVLCAIPFTAFMQSIFPFILRDSAPASVSYGGYGTPGGYPPPPAGYPPQNPYSGQPYNGGNPGQSPYPPQQGYGAPTGYDASGNAPFNGQSNYPNAGQGTPTDPPSTDSPGYQENRE